MANLMTVKEMKEMLANFNDNDVLMIEGGESWTGEWARMGIAKEEKGKFDNGTEWDFWNITDTLFEMD